MMNYTFNLTSVRDYLKQHFLGRKIYSYSRERRSSGVCPNLVAVGDDVLQFLELVDDGWNLWEPVEGEDEVPQLAAPGQLWRQSLQLVVPATREIMIIQQNCTVDKQQHKHTAGKNNTGQLLRKSCWLLGGILTQDTMLAPRLPDVQYSESEEVPNGGWDDSESVVTSNYLR